MKLNSTFFSVFCLSFSVPSIVLDVVALVRERVEMPKWFGALTAYAPGFVGTVITVGATGATVAAPGHGVGEEGVCEVGTTRQHCCVVLHFLVGTTPLE